MVVSQVLCSLVKIIRIRALQIIIAGIEQIIHHHNIFCGIAQFNMNLCMHGLFYCIIAENRNNQCQNEQGYHAHGLQGAV